jgi:ABC-2 type transport system permease protein
MTAMVMSRARVAWYAAAYAVAEVRAQVGLAGWFLASFIRVLAQVLFFGLLGRAVGDADQVRFLVIGNAVVLVALETLFVVLSTVMERNQGTLVVLAASPTSPANVYLARGLQWVASATITSTVALLSLPFVLGVPVPLIRLPLVVPVLFVIGLSCNAYGAALSSVVLHSPSATWLLINLGYLVVAAFGGVNVPTSFWPGWFQGMTSMLPLGHGLHAVRALLDGSPVTGVLADVLAELVVGACWFGVALLAYRQFVVRSTRDGTLDFS